MKKTLIHCGLLILLIATGIIALADSAYAASGGWSSTIAGWFSSKSSKPAPQAEPSPAAVAAKPESAAAPIAPIVVHWGISNFPAVAINQKNYPDINLTDYFTADSDQNNFIFSLTSDKPNPNWVSVSPNGFLHIATDKISPEDLNTTQVIYLTATNAYRNQSNSTEMTIQITTNDQLPAPHWSPSFALHDAIPNKAYFVNLAEGLNLNNLPDNEQLMFQIVKSEADWLQIGENGFSITAKKIPEDAADKSYNIILRVSGKLSGKSDDLNGKIYVNPIPQPLQWQAAPAATLNQNYSLDLSKTVSSNIRNDQLSFNVDIATLPHWLSIQNNHVLAGVPQDAALVSDPQKVTVIAKSAVSGLTSKQVFIIPVNTDQQLAPQWKKDFLANPITGEAYRSDDLSTVLNNRYAHDDLSFTYINGPDWLTFNNFCHCVTSKGAVPEEAAGKTFTLTLRVHSKASGKTTDYEQSLMVYTGIPRWTQSNLPDVKISQGNVQIPLNNYIQDDISGDHFTYRVDAFHSPRWVSIDTQGEQIMLTLHADLIAANEVGTAQTVRVIATSQRTSKTSTQLFSVSVKPNTALATPLWKMSPLAVATVGFQHVMDLAQYVQGSTPDDRLTITLGPNSPSWLSVKNNRLIGIAPRDQIGGPYPLNLVVHSQATGLDTTIQTSISVQLAVVEGDNMEIHSFYDNHQSIVIRGLKKNAEYRLFSAKGTHFDYGPFYSPYAIKTADDWNNNPFYSVSSNRTIKTGDDGTVSIVYYSLPTSPAPDFQMLILR